MTEKETRRDQDRQMHKMNTRSLYRGLTMAVFLTGWSAAEISAGTGPLDIRVDSSTRQYTFYEGEAPVLTYPFGTVPVPEGVSGQYAVARSNYVHPLYGPNGEVLTTDYAHDHPHHRGFYWAWPEVTFQGETRDLHALQGVFARPVAIRKQEVRNDDAELVAENVWLWGDETPIVRETVTLRTGRERRGLRTIDFQFRFEALEPGVTLARRNQDTYGGLNVRLSARTDQQIVKHLEAGGYPWPAAWAELTGVPPEGREPIGIFILQSPANPEYPGDWVEYPDLNWLQPAFPSAGTAYPLDPARPLVLAYRIVIRSGAGLKVPPAELFAAYATELPGPLDSAATYQAGQDRSPLTAIENRLRDSGPSGHLVFETEVIKQLANPAATGDFKRWACSQLVQVGTDASVPMAVGLLGDDTAWMQATDVLLARPGDAGVMALSAALPNLARDRRAAVIHRLGIRRDPRAVSLLVTHIESSDPGIAIAALTALGEIGSINAGKILARQPAGDTTYDACLRAASRLAEDDETDQAVSLYSLVWNAPEARPWQRAASLVGLAGVRPGQTADIVREHLASPDRHLRNGAARTLLQLDASALAGMRAGYPRFDTPARLALLHAWATQGVQATEPEFLDALAQTDEVLRAAAVRGLRRVGSVAAVAPLLDTALVNKDLAKDAIATLTQIPGEDVAETLYATIDDPNPERAALAIEVVGLRRPPGYLDRLILVLRQDRREPFRETMTVLRNAATPAQIPALRTGLLSAPTDRAKDLALALVAICQRQDNPQACLAEILDPDPKVAGTARAAMLTALPALGGDRALDFVAAVRDEPSVRALIKWPDAAAIEPLLTILQDPEAGANVRRLATAGLVSCAKRVLPEDCQVLALQSALNQVTEESLRAELLNALADLSTVNLALGKPATGSDPHQGGGIPALAVDGNPATFWSCATSPTSLTVDLETIQTLARIRVITYHSDQRFYQYQVAISADGQAWNPVADLRANTELATEAGITHRFAPTPARYLQVTMLKNSANPGMHICELEAYSSTPTEEKTP